MQQLFQSEQKTNFPHLILFRPRLYKEMDVIWHHAGGKEFVTLDPSDALIRVRIPRSFGDKHATVSWCRS